MVLSIDDAVKLQRNPLHQLRGALSPDSDDDVSERLGHEARLAVRKVVLPLSASCL